MNLSSLDCVKLIHELYMAMIFVSYLFCMNLCRLSNLWSRLMLSGWSSKTSTHLVLLVGGVFHWHITIVLWLCSPFIFIYCSFSIYDGLYWFPYRKVRLVVNSCGCGMCWFVPWG